jgi:inner membrane protein YidH
VTGNDARQDRGPTEPGRAAATGDGKRPGRSGETEPDARFTLANQRTFLAWSRTALALVAAGLGIVQLLPPFPGVPSGRQLIGLPLIVLGAATAAGAYRDWGRAQTALRRSHPQPRSVLPLILTATVTAVAVAAAVVVLISAAR